MAQAKKPEPIKTRVPVGKRAETIDLSATQPTNQALMITLSEMVNEVFDGNFDHQVGALH